jgi:ribonuclease PH
MRPSGRKNDQLRTITLEPHYMKHAEGSCLIKFGDTHVICTATVEEKIPPFLKNSGSGWITAEYGMLPRSTHTRFEREASKGKQTGRTQEIQRFIGRSLRSITNLKALGERQIKIDCDVIQADGGTRTASITGAYVALYYALTQLVDKKLLPSLPLVDSIAAISCGIYKGNPVLDLDYEEDSNAEADANFILTGRGKIVEIQATAEESAFEETEFFAMLQLARNGIKQLTQKQLSTIMGSSLKE